MGVDTHGYVSRKITASDIYNVICDKFDKNAEFAVKVEKRANKEEEIGWIYFKDGEDDRQLFICYGERYDGDGNDAIDFPDNKYVYLSLGFWNNSVKIITEIVQVFGGYVDENDCDDTSAIYIPSNTNSDFSEYIKRREQVMAILDESLGHTFKSQIASQILKHEKELKEYFS